mmetsp:Transcript_53485/g.81127  ORF Transcript_53485/g.81127 Transcript_53485/m.81127 type:complete len:140 (+) Transcript_53485:150-569(+)
MLGGAGNRIVRQNLCRTVRLTHRWYASKAKDGGSLYISRAGLPLVLFCGLGVWVVANGIEGKNKERDAFQGRMSKSDRQARLEQEHDDMVEKLNKIVSQDFDNTKRIERPDEILARRRKEREDRNVWYRRYWRAMTGKE